MYFRAKEDLIDRIDFIHWNWLDAKNVADIQYMGEFFISRKGKTLQSWSEASY